MSDKKEVDEHLDELLKRRDKLQKELDKITGSMSNDGGSTTAKCLAQYIRVIFAFASVILFVIVIIFFIAGVFE